MKYSVVTFGCRVNQADSLAIDAAFHARGCEAVPSERADLVVINTCSVTAAADQGARQTIRRIARDNPAARIVVTGCYATRRPAEVAALPGVAAIVPNDEKAPPAFFRALDAAGCAPGAHARAAPPAASLHASARQPASTLLPWEHPPAPAPGFGGRTAWLLRVQTGCSESCSYCIIPSTRGPSRSRPLDDIRAEVARVVAAGYKEIAITGVHLGSYGRDLSPASSLAALVEAIADRALCRVSSLEPMDFPMQLLDLPVAPHFHLPLQHASNRMLEAMKRPYTIEGFDALVRTIRRRLPHAALGTDVIVGFPGETDEDFEALALYLEGSPLTYLHVFPYSARPGTPAASMPGTVDGAVVKARAARLREISCRLGENFRASLRGMMRPALTIEDGSVAVTDNYLRVPAPPGHGRNEWVRVAL